MGSNPTGGMIFIRNSLYTPFCNQNFKLIILQLAFKALINAEF